MDDKKNPILIVDDDVHLRRTISDVLSLKGFIPFIAENGRQALDQIQQTGNVVVALIDLRLEGMNGLQLLKNIKSASPDTECILFTGYASQESVIEAINLGAFSYIQKPFDMELLLVTIQRAVEKNIDKTMLRENEKRFRSLYENAALGIYRVTPDGQILLANPALVEMLGYDSFEELAKQNLGKPVYAAGYSHADFQQQIERDWLVRGYEVGYQRKDGSIVFMRESARVIRDENGHSLYYEGSMEDITERRQAELALKASEARYRMLAENMSDTVWLMDMNLRTTYISPSVTRLRGYTLDELNELPYEQQMTPASLSRLMQLMAEALSPENIQNPNLPISRKVELELYRKDGSSFWSENEFIVIRDQDGLPMNILGAGRDITDRKRAEEAIKETNAKLILAQRVAHIGSWEYYLPTNELHWSDEMYHILGFPPNTPINLAQVDRVFPPEELERFQQAVTAATNEDAPYSMDYKIVRLDGSVRYIHDEGEVVRDEHGQATRMFGTTQDITERKLAEDALRQSEAALRKAQQVAHVGSWTWRVQSNQLEWSDEVHHIFGIERENFTGDFDEVITRAIHPEDHLKVEQANLSMIKDKQPSALEYRVIRPDGAVRVVWDETGELILDEAGAPAVITGIVQDITARKQAEEEIRRRVNELEALYESGLEISGILDPKRIGQKIVDVLTQRMKWHHASARMYHPETNKIELLALNIPGLSPEQTAQEIIRLQSSIQHPGQGLSGWVIQQGESLRTGDIVSDPRYVPTYPDMRSGLYVPVKIGSMTIGCLGVESEQPNAFTEQDERFLNTAAAQAGVGLENARLVLALQQELKERLRAETALRDLNLKLEQRVQERTAELQAAYLELEHASRLKDEFLASMSHELRTPLTGILNISEALKEQIYGSLNEKQVKSLSMLEESGQHLLGLINDILDVSKLDAGLMKLQVERFRVSVVCQSSLQLVRAMAQKKRQMISFSIEPPFAELDADPLRLKQILVNLLSNACKFTPEDGQIGLEVYGDVDAQALKFTVWDGGIGIAPEDMPKLFKAFVQIDSSLSRQHSGTGLGLALVQRLVELQGGRVMVTSNPGQGSRFTVSLPWQAQAQPVEDQLVSEEKIAAGLLEKVRAGRQSPMLTDQLQPPGQEGTGSLILFVDDNETNSMVYGDFLLSRGYRLELATDGFEALRRAEETWPDLIVMDIQMPGMDGLEVIHRLRSHTDPRVAASAILAMTALAMPGDRERCLAAGADEYLSRPVSLKKLEAVIQEQLAHRS